MIWYWLFWHFHKSPWFFVGRGNLDGEKNKAAAKHPGNIVATVDVFRHRPGPSIWESVHVILIFFCRRIRIFPHGNLLLSRNSSGLSTVKGSFSSFTVITTIARPLSDLRCGLDLNWNVLRLEYRDWIIQELLCPCPPTWSHGGQMKTCSNMQEEAWNPISFYQSRSCW